MHERLIPAADSIPVDWRWFQILLLVAFLLHVVLMNLIRERRAGYLCFPAG
ncbi:MAG: hypothetical protein JW748_00080 [Anaerolineales bacterium]|nr:hypothetical protein [Anaerolineales bacterium]